MSTDENKCILIIEDERDMIRGLRDALGFEGFDTTAADRGHTGIRQFLQHRPDLVLLDLMLPDINGYQVCEEMRRIDKKIPIVMLTARNQETDIVRGLEAGADDYVTKPFSVAELVARINAVLRRVERTAAPTKEFAVGKKTVNLTKHLLRSERSSQPLSYYETELLRVLHDRLGEPVSRDELLEKIWGLDPNPNNRTVDNFVVKLRRKIEKDPSTPKHILTVYGFGYKLVD
jgi:DNA-binding response OmpR family regulator